MLSPHLFIESLQKYDIDFFAGVPDSLLKSVCAYITDHVASKNHIIAANEGAAVGLATGYYLATRKIPVVYMQNSGIGNAVNPLMSLTDKEVYHIPLILLIGWRGEPGISDEPQHKKQGEATIPLLKAMGIKYIILSKYSATFKRQLEQALNFIQETGEPVAFIVHKNTFEDYTLTHTQNVDLEMSREEAIQTVVSSIKENDAVVSTTGMISRELFEIREHLGQSHNKDFLTVGSMGHASQIALGIALQKPGRKVYCFDGDGATIMHMGALAINGAIAPANFVHIVFNNGAHDSVGGQPTVGFVVDLFRIASICGYKKVFSIDNKKELMKTLKYIDNMELPLFIEIKVKKGARKDLGRPTISPVINKENFISFLK